MKNFIKRIKRDKIYINRQPGHGYVMHYTPNHSELEQLGIFVLPSVDWGHICYGSQFQRITKNKDDTCLMYASCLLTGDKLKHLAAKYTSDIESYQQFVPANERETKYYHEQIRKYKLYSKGLRLKNT